jgi:hypothetical protein
MIMAAIICVFSIAAFLQFFVWHCRSIIASSRRVELSERVREVAGVESRDFNGEDFNRLLQLVRLCPDRGDDRGEIRAVGTYYGLLNVLGRIARQTIPPVAAWAEQERESCSYFAAVALDRRISYSRDLFTQQIADRL